jgi:hypothetical protein
MLDVPTAPTIKIGPRKPRRVTIRAIDPEVEAVKVRSEKEKIARKIVHLEEKKQKRRFRPRTRLALIVQLLNDPRVERAAKRRVKGSS